MNTGTTFSAGELEKFSYCPLSWWLGRDGKADVARTAEGSRRHVGLSSDLQELSASQKSVVVYSRMIMYYALISTVLSIIGISLLDFNGKQLLSRLLLLLAVIWVIIAASLVYIGGRGLPRVKESEKWSVYTALSGVAFATVSITTLQASQIIADIFESVSLVWLIAASAYLYFSLTAEKSAATIAGTRRVEGKVIYVGDEDHPVLYSADRLLSGKPDFIIEEEGKVVPCEFKSGRKPAGPLFSHIMQLSAYCKIVADNYGIRPEYGYIYYGTDRFQIDYDDELEGLVRKKIDEMRECLASGEAHRNHRRPGKCASCSRRSVCPERLV